jgi:hypothetical protein
VKENLFGNAEIYTCGKCLHNRIVSLRREVWAGLMRGGFFFSSLVTENHQRTDGPRDRLRLLSKLRVCCPVKPLINFHTSQSECYIIIFLNTQKMKNPNKTAMVKTMGPLVSITDLLILWLFVLLIYLRMRHSPTEQLVIGDGVSIMYNVS